MKLFWRALLVAALLPMCGGIASAQSRQEHVHEMGHHVMPFDLSKTLHIFKMTESGGEMRVIARDPKAAEQIALIRGHLQHEAESFQQGDYGDPASLHGADMPGLKELEAGAARIEVSYAALPNGAQIRFVTPDVHLLTALHRWFGAQLSEHGADARAE
jgi:hypothetical protein